MLTTIAFAQQASEPPTLTLTTITVPGAKVTLANGINSEGEIVGAFGESLLGPSTGFLYSGGTFTYFNYPGQDFTSAQGINDSGLIVGFATQEAGRRSSAVGFLYDGVTFTTLQDGSNPVTYAYGINNAGTVVGSAGPDLAIWSGFEEQSGKYRPVKLPGQGCPYEFVNGINGFGEIVADTSCGLDDYGYAVQNGKATRVQVPGTIQTVPLGINDNGIIVGWYGSGGHFHGFAYSHGKYISFSYPGENYTFASGINNSGQIVGYYSSDNTTYHGFVSSPIAPADFDLPGCCQAAVVEGR